MLSLLYLSSAALYVAKPAFARQAQADLGYQVPHLVQFLVVVKLLAPAAILSRVSLPLSDLAYAGMFFHLLLSAMAHLGVRKPQGAIPAIVGLALLAASFMTQNAVRDGISPYSPASAAHAKG
ncbi:DoxX family protein [Sphingomonas pituitosa]|uniref:DoxX family protein n=1 Tax=Sphingomonas pituitosa TaxID=99597 RepID=UPI001C3FD636|nr:DoxX family protein [Sphingomonas pituitosa]